MSTALTVQQQGDVFGWVPGEMGYGAKKRAAAGGMIIFTIHLYETGYHSANPSIPNPSIITTFHSLDSGSPAGCRAALAHRIMF
jgi:hypothetical protein